MIEISHTYAQRLIQESLDRQIPEGTWAALQSHLENCPDCRNYHSVLKGLEKEFQRGFHLRWDGIPGPQQLSSRAVLADRYARRKIRQRIAFSLTLMVVAVFFTSFGGWQWLSSLGRDEGGNANRTRIDQKHQPGFDPSLTQTEAPATQQDEAFGKTALPILSALPTAQPGDFGSLIVYASRLRGNSDLYLLNPGSVALNLSELHNKPSVDDTDPSWSPDGEWIAYLSNLTGKSEVFITGLAGRNPIQITDEPGIDWVGPLSWSPDGQWIAITGVRREQGNQSWIYLISPDGSIQPRALAGTRGGWAPEFSPIDGRLAFFVSDKTGLGISIFYFENWQRSTGGYDYLHWNTPFGENIPVNSGVIRLNSGLSKGAAAALPVNSEIQNIFSKGFGLDWSPDGTGLVMLGDNLSADNRSYITIGREMNNYVSLYDISKNKNTLASSPRPNEFHSVSWLPSGNVVYLAKRSQAGQERDPSLGCWILQAQPDSRDQEGNGLVLMDGLCVYSGLDYSSHSSDGRWIVLTGRQANDNDPGLFAIMIPNNLERKGPGSSKLIKLAEGSALAGVQPQVRPRPVNGKNLSIHPQPVTSQRTRLKPSDLFGVKGAVVFSLHNNAVTVIVRSNPDGTGGRVLTSSNGNNRCPRFSPNGKQVAFISDDPGELIPATGKISLGRGGGYDLPPPILQASAIFPGPPALAAVQPLPVEEIYVLPEDGGAPERVSNAAWIPEGSAEAAGFAPIYSCPSWSPDGNYLAATMTTIRESFLALFPLDPARQSGALARFIPIPGIVEHLSWTADSRRLIISLKGKSPQNVQFLTITIPDHPEENPQVNTKNVQVTEGSIAALTVSPDGGQAFLFSTQDAGQAVVERISLTGTSARQIQPSGGNLTFAGSSPGFFAWADDNNLGLILRGKPEDQYKSYIEHYDVREGKAELLLPFEDTIFDAAWSKDGRWVIFSAESGLWALNVDDARQGKAGPVWISPEPVNDLDWQEGPASSN